MKFLYNKAPQLYFYNIHTLIIAVMSTNKSYIVKMNGYGDIYANGEYGNYFYMVCFTSFPYKLQEYFESDGNKLESGDLI